MTNPKVNLPDKVKELMLDKVMELMAAKVKELILDKVKELREDKVKELMANKDMMKKERVNLFQKGFMEAKELLHSHQILMTMTYTRIKMDIMKTRTKDLEINNEMNKEISQFLRIIHLIMIKHYSMTKAVLNKDSKLWAYG